MGVQVRRERASARAVLGIEFAAAPEWLGNAGEKEM
jgi:hypothetical protein